MVIPCVTRLAFQRSDSRVFRQGAFDAVPCLNSVLHQGLLTHVQVPLLKSVCHHSRNPGVKGYTSILSFQCSWCFPILRHSLQCFQPTVAAVQGSHPIFGLPSGQSSFQDILHFRVGPPFQSRFSTLSYSTLWSPCMMGQSSDSAGTRKGVYIFLQPLVQLQWSVGCKGGATPRYRVDYSHAF
ncbi:uncharacterized protein EI97DRAFT_8272 [Westerdykella ornata]|uniref:Uncharacterized protein n=1 Tax=Westerdykella ornata TaxID=318751 RepID=A0A6A6K0A4_WESOR|nr:uncharacterized protein EI97DRAFT_8272 [Westerdykella ornata]KAF2280779.1 hypothetical protein EI97DRAFT_8272 [Westerdykella ornata]